MEKIAYKSIWSNGASRFITECPYRRSFSVGSRECFFCKHCKGIDIDSVTCSYKEENTKPVTHQEYHSLDVMVDGEFRKTIRVKATGLKIIDGVLWRVLTDDDIKKEVAARCPLVYKYEKWHVEFNF